MTNQEILQEIREIRRELAELEISDNKRKIGNAVAFLSGALSATAFLLAFFG